MYFVGIDISKYKHDCFITDEHGEVFFEDAISNNREGLNNLYSVLCDFDKNQNRARSNRALRDELETLFGKYSTQLFRIQSCPHLEDFQRSIS